MACARRPGACRQIRGHHGVVGGGVGEGLGGQARARGELAPAPVRVELREQRAVVGRVHDHQHGGVVLGRGAQHGGSADVDVLDRLLVAAAGTGDGGGEGVEVHHQQVDGRNAVLGHDGIIDAAAAEQSPVDLRVQRLDAPVHDLGEAGVARDLGGREPCAASSRRCRRWTGSRSCAARATRASSMRPVLSETERSARRTGSGMASRSSDGPAGSGPRDVRPQEPPSPNCLSFLRSVPRLMPRMPAARLWLPSA